MIKEALFNKCLTLIEERIAHIRHTIQEAREASYDESKSSMGDKYETTKSMLQYEQEKMGVQLNEALKMKKAIQQIGCKKEKEKVEAGSLVYTTGPVFYLLVSLGKQLIDNEEFLVVSPVSPVGKLLLDKKVGDSVPFNQQHISIETIM